MEESKSSPIRMVILAAGIVILLIGMKIGAEVVAPILLSIFLAAIFYPVLMWLRRRGISRSVSMVLTLLSVVAIGIFLLALIFITLLQIREIASGFQINSDIPFSEYANLAIRNMGDYLRNLDLVRLLRDAIFILFATCFFILGLPKIRENLYRRLGSDNETLNRLTTFAGKITKYWIIRIEVNIFTGVGATVVLILLGVNYAILWGVVAFGLSFIPYIGYLLASIPPFLLAWSEHGIVTAVLVLVAYAIVNVVAENFIFPRQAGVGLDISFYIVFVSIFFWGFILGGIGLLIAVPLTMVGIEFLGSIEETKWLTAFFHR